MGIRFIIYPTARLVAYTVDGNATAEDARTFLDAVVTHRHFERGFDFLGDRFGDEEEPDTTFLRAIALEVRSRVIQFAPCRWAVVDPSPVAFGMVKMWGILVQESGLQVAPFTDMSEASEWVGANTAERMARWPTF
jgi:hypothetical protein